MESKGNLLYNILNEGNLSELNSLFPGYSKRFPPLIQENKLYDIAVMLLKEGEITIDDFLDYMSYFPPEFRLKSIDRKILGMPTCVAIYNSLPVGYVTKIDDKLIRPISSIIVAAGDKETFFYLIDKIIDIDIVLFILFVGAAFNKDSIVWLNDISNNLDEIIEQFCHAVVSVPEAIVNSKYVHDYLNLNLNSSDPLPDWVPWMSTDMFGFYEFLYQTGYYPYQFFADWYETTHDDILLKWLYDI